MGWLRGQAKNASSQDTTSTLDPAEASRSESKLENGISKLSLDETKADYPRASLSTPDTLLRFIPKSEVQAHCPASPIQGDNDADMSGSADTAVSSTLPLWLIIDDVIYDCTEFVLEHPGGTQVIESFRGHDCSWQFWRFHGREHLEEFGRPLRVGRTKGFQNRFEEQPRWVGLRKLGVDEDFCW